MSFSLGNNRESPKLSHLTRDRPSSPGRRTPSKTFLQNSFNENDFHHSPSISEKKNVKMPTMNRNSGPPPVSKKPEVAQKPIVAKKPAIALPSKSSNSNSTFRDNLNKKLALPFPGKPPAENGHSHRNGPLNNNGTSGNINAITKELEAVIGQQNQNHRAPNHENPKSDRTISLTEVSTLKTEEKSTKFMMNDTLEMMTDEGFDTTNDDNILTNLNSDIDLSPDEDDDELFANFKIPPPPPPAVDFSDSEWDDSILSKGRNPSVSGIYNLLSY